jgi:hypothetical protein
MAEERVILEDEADIPLLHGEAEGILLAEENAAFGREVEAAEDAQKRRLAGARRSQQRQELARGDLQGHAVEGRRIAEALRDILDGDVHVLAPFARERPQILCGSGAGVAGSEPGGDIQFVSDSGVHHFVPINVRSCGGLPKARARSAIRGMSSGRA